MFKIFQYPEFILTWSQCVIPSISSVISNIFCMVLLNVLLNLVLRCSHAADSVSLHMMSVLLGIVLLGSSIAVKNLYHYMIFLVGSYATLRLVYLPCLKRKIPSTYAIGVIFVGYLLVCEFLHPYPILWLQSRGVFMIASMKIISLSFSIERGLSFPSILAFFGYTCFPGNILFGPWLPYTEYLSVKSRNCQINLNWMCTIMLSGIISLLFLTASNCWGNYIIADNSYKWLVAYRQAFSFRASHYFVSYLSETAMLASGYTGGFGTDAKKLIVTRPLDIEFPSSLVSVVISWNIPMHSFLKEYVYKPARKLGRFKAIIVTYFVSALLHGLNFEIATVLLTIGIFSFMQLNFQAKLSSVFNACLNVRACNRNCSHKYKRNNIFIKFAHIIFSFTTVMTLAYLGILVDSIGQEDSSTIIHKWNNLNFIPHIMMFFMYLMSITM